MFLSDKKSHSLLRKISMNFNTIVWTNDDEDGGDLYIDDASVYSTVCDIEDTTTTLLPKCDISECVVRKIKVKDILVKRECIASSPAATKSSALWVANPYVGCPYGCSHCPAKHMREYAKHREKWGKFIDVKYWDDLGNFDGGDVLISTLTDPYNPFEEKCCRTRELLKQLLANAAKIHSLTIRTTSNLVERDMDLIRQFKNVSVEKVVVCY